MPAVAIAGLSVRNSDSGDAPADESTGDGGSDDADEEESEEVDRESNQEDDREAEPGVDPDPAEIAVAAEWAAMRARLRDALALGRAGEPGTGATVARRIFERFEGATGEYGAHEVLERTDESAYHEFEEALGELRTEGLDSGDLGRASEEVEIADDRLRRAQRSLVGETAAQALDVLLFGVSVRNAAVLSIAGHHDAAATSAETVLERYGDSDAHDALSSAAPDAYARFEGWIEETITAAERGDADAVRKATDETLGAAVEGSYAVADADATASAGHVAAMQSQGYDAAALASMGGPPRSFAHAAALTAFRARASDAVWIGLGGETDRAEAVVRDVLVEFETARAHEGLEEADPDAYEGFERGLEELASALGEGDLRTAQKSLRRVNQALVSGITALGSGDAPAVLEAAHFRARVEDVRTLYQLGERDAAATTVRRLVRTFEANEANFHEVFEETDHDAYEAFEGDLSSLQSAIEGGDAGTVESLVEDLQDRLLEFETTVGSTAQVGGAEAAYLTARAMDAAGLSVLGSDAAETRLSGAFEYFEAGAGGFHDTLEEADHARYESFENALGTARTAAAEEGEVYPAVRDFALEAVDTIYTVVSAAGGSNADAAADLAGSIFESFETAEVHEALEEGDHETYEAFEATLQEYISTLRDGGDARAAADEFATAALRAQFAVSGAIDQAPDAEGGDHGDHDHGHDGEMEGGPNVVEGVPDDADHVVDLTAVAFDPDELTVSAGDTVAWTHAGGEPHTATAYEEDIPDGADYWASGGFDSEAAAREGWENGSGAVQAGESYVHTFETTGSHEYLCIPHEAAGMTGTVVVE